MRLVLWGRAAMLPVVALGARRLGRAGRRLLGQVDPLPEALIGCFPGSHCC